MEMTKQGREPGNGGTCFDVARESEKNSYKPSEFARS